jgi:hypothetical protein
MADYIPEHRAGDEPDPVIGDAPPKAHTIFSNKVYDRLKFLAMVLLPALGAAYFGIAGIWGLPKAQEVVGTIVVIDTFLGVLLGISSTQYSNSDDRFDGQIRVSPNEEGNSDLSVSLNPQSIADKKEIVVKVAHD